MGSPESASPAAVAGAFELLRTEPTRAALSTVGPTAAPDSAGVAGRHAVTRLTEVDFVRDLARAYSEGLGTPHLAVGGACGLQHYAGRCVLAALGLWLQTGCLPDLDHARWQVELDEQGRTLSVAPPLTGAARVEGAHEAADAILEVHLAPVVRAVREAARITKRVALGCIAASCAGAFATLHRRTAPEEQPEVAELAARFVSAPAWRAARPLVDLREIAVPAGAAIVHERHVCCLIRLGRDRGACGTCPDIDSAERRRRITTHAADAARGTDLPLGVTCVP